LKICCLADSPAHRKSVRLVAPEAAGERAMKYVMCRHIMLGDQGKDEYDVPRGRKAGFG
jgi:hypothetical protein